MNTLQNAKMSAKLPACICNVLFTWVITGLSIHLCFSPSFPHLSLSTPLISLNCLFTPLHPIHLQISSFPFTSPSIFPPNLPHHLDVSYHIYHIAISIIFSVKFHVISVLSHLSSLYFNHNMSACVSYVWIYLFQTFHHHLGFLLSLNHSFLCFCRPCSQHRSEKAVVWDGAVFGGRRLWPVSQ